MDTCAHVVCAPCASIADVGRAGCRGEVNPAGGCPQGENAVLQIRGKRRTSNQGKTPYFKSGENTVLQIRGKRRTSNQGKTPYFKLVRNFPRFFFSIGAEHSPCGQTNPQQHQANTCDMVKFNSDAEETRADITERHMGPRVTRARVIGQRCGNTGWPWPDRPVFPRSMSHGTHDADARHPPPPSPYPRHEEPVLAALLCCVPFGDRNPRIPFPPVHSRLRRCGIFPVWAFPRRKIPRTENAPRPVPPERPA